jgi:hypothetical protein
MRRKTQVRTLKLLPSGSLILSPSFSEKKQGTVACVAPHAMTGSPFDRTSDNVPFVGNQSVACGRLNWPRPRLGARTQIHPLARWNAIRSLTPASVSAISMVFCTTRGPWIAATRADAMTPPRRAASAMASRTTIGDTPAAWQKASAGNSRR